MTSELLGLIFGGGALAISAFQLGVWWREQHPKPPTLRACDLHGVEDCEECQDWLPDVGEVE